MYFLCSAVGLEGRVVCYLISYSPDTIDIAKLICERHERLLQLKHFYNALKKVHVSAEYTPASIFQGMSGDENSSPTAPGKNSSAPEGSQIPGEQAKVDDKKVKHFKLQQPLLAAWS